jgi:hypothetical protein
MAHRPRSWKERPVDNKDFPRAAKLRASPVVAAAASLILAGILLNPRRLDAGSAPIDAGKFQRIGQQNQPDGAIVRRGPLGVITRRIYEKSPGPGVAAVVSVSYLGPGLRRREVHAHEAKSDLGEKYRERYSEDNGRTWSDFRPVSLGTDTLKQGGNFMEESAFAVNFDPVSKRTIEVIFQRIFLGDPQQALAAYWRGETRFYDHCYYRLSEDDGRTFTEYRQLTYENGAPFDPKNWTVPEFLGKNQMYGGYDIAVLSNGTIAYPAIIPVAYEEDEEDQRVCAKVPWYAGKNRVYGALCFVGKWNEARKDYVWSVSRPLSVRRRVSTRGFAEPAVAELKDGRLVMELRGSNVYLDPVRYPGRKWLSVSADGGRSWKSPLDLRYDTGEQFYAPATFAKFIRSRKTGKLYWVGNISRDPAEGNGPRYPLYLAEVDEEKAALKKSTLTVIDNRGPGDTEGLQLSNFSLLENGETGDLEIYLSRLGEKPGSVFSANAYKYTIILAI